MKTRILLILALLIVCAIGIFVAKIQYRNKAHISIEKKEIWNKYPVISEKADSYRIKIPCNTEIELPKTGEWAKHPALKNMKHGGVWYRYRKENR